MQKVNYKIINKKELFDSFKADAYNVDLESGDIRLKSDHVYKFGNVLLDDNNLSIIDIAIDECDIFYLVDEKRNLVFIYDPHNDALKAIGCYPGILPLKMNTLSAIGVDRDTLYIADLVTIGADNARLIALAKKDFQIRWVLCKGPDGKPLHKVLDIECDNKGNVRILENETGRILSISKESVDYPTPHLVYSPDPGTLKPKDLAVDTQSNLYVLYENKLHIFYAKTGEKEIPILPDSLSPSGLVVDAWDQIFIGESGHGSEKEISLKTIHKLSGEIFTPLWSYRGASRKLISDSLGNLYVLDDKGNKLTSMVRQKVHLPDKEGAFRGSYVSKPINSQTPDTQWHRLLLEGEFEKGTQVEFFYYVSNDEVVDIKTLDPDQWRKCISEASSVQGNNKRDALFLEDVEGRYLWFRIVLSGTETRSPVVKKITVFFPRVSYLDHLPAIYREDLLSKGLLERFLAIFESMFFDIDRTIEHMGRYFDAYGTPPEFLSWLGSWLALAGEEDWPEDKKRLFISKAVSLYKKRGTRDGLEEIIQLLTGKKPFIVEVFKGKNPCKDVTAEYCNEQNFQEKMIFFPPEEVVVKACLDENTLKRSDKDGTAEAAYQEIPLIDILYGTARFGFCVIFEDPDMDPITIGRVRRIIEEQKPAHTCYGLKVLQPWLYLDMHTYLGINTKLIKPEFVLGFTSVIGRDTLLDDEEHAGQVERHARVGIDSVIL
ncbi:phage tail protein [uncultured Methanomethylovorans sp.]|uniref:phage tail protein n=1 Tax=uncultured Methanomethylovorans sp. TaxID=183759 RepID=UPI0026120BDB|nr:phage tail protein [uncultured Methanomethylovorans sp.]